ncbi:MAG: hypothetical protein IKH60_02755 [Bacteroidales bacterium]|jgi:hypothetical protein|nr:hypothetical protein [Bacteroidales bacterium]
MVYSYKVTLTGIKGFHRIYHLSGENTLYTFHKQMRSDMEFPQDQLILFKAFDASGAVVARYGLFDLGNGAVDEITIASVVKKGIKSFVYFYDVTNKKSVNISFEGIVEGASERGCPVLADIKGPNPIEFENGYIAFEDLPDDQRHLPSESDRNRKKSLDALLSALKDEDDSDDDLPMDSDEEDEEDEEEDNIRDDEDGMEIFDGSEDLTL